MTAQLHEAARGDFKGTSSPLTCARAGESGPALAAFLLAPVPRFLAPTNSSGGIAPQLRQGTTRALPAFEAAMMYILLLLLAAAGAQTAEAAKCFGTFSRSDFASCLAASPTVAIHWSIVGDDIKLGVVVDGTPGWIGEKPCAGWPLPPPRPHLFTCRWPPRNIDSCPCPSALAHRC